jgi:hypothetical protein
MAKLATPWADILLDLADTVSHRSPHGSKEIVQLLGVSFRHDDDTTVGQIADVAGDGKTGSDPAGGISKAYPLDGASVIDFPLLLARFRHARTSPSFWQV